MKFSVNGVELERKKSTPSVHRGDMTKIPLMWMVLYLGSWRRVYGDIIKQVHYVLVKGSRVRVEK